MRRRCLAVLVAAACSNDRPAAPADAVVPADAAEPDARRGPDAQYRYCTAAAGTAAVSASSPGGGPASYNRLHAGGVLLGGPVAPVEGVPMTAMLLLTSVDPIDAGPAYCCSASDMGCCPHDGLVVTTGVLPFGAELGDHPVMIKSFRDAAFSISGTVTFERFVSPFVQEWGHIAGSIAASSNGFTVSGTFDHVFCAALLAGTI